MIGAPTPTDGVEVVLPPARSAPLSSLPDLAPSLGPGTLGEPIVGSGRPTKLPRRRLGRHAASMLTLVVLVAAVAGAFRLRAGLRAIRPLRFAPVVVMPPLQMDGALVLGAARDWAVHRSGPLRYGDPVPVELTAYCLRGTTRRDNYVREGIVASDPRMFPLGRYLEIYVGRQYYGRFLIDDTGGVIKGNKLDIWTPTCREARIFGRTKGTAVLVPRPRGARPDTITTGRLGGRA